jgi:hypothetical protein
MEEYLTRCVIDPQSKKIYIYSSEGNEKNIVCETTDQFMNVLELIRSVVDDDIIAYVEPITSSVW